MSSGAPVLGRRALLLAAAAGALAGASGCTDPPTGPTGPAARPDPAGRPGRPTTQEAAIFDLSLETTERFRPLELLAPGFVDVDVEPSASEDLTRAGTGPPAPFAAVALDVGAPGAGSQPLLAGLASERGADGAWDGVWLRWSPSASRLSIEVRSGGRTRVLRRRKVGVEGPFTLGFALCENQVTALLDTGEGWVPVLTERTKVAKQLDLRREAVLQRLRYAWAADAHVSRVRAGLFGMTGVRDPHLVQHADGTPYERDGRAYLTWTSAGLGFFQQAHWSVWSFDPAAPRDMRLEAQLFTRRDGLVLGDHAGHLVRDGDQWLVATSSWGDFTPGSIHVRHTSTDADLLRGVHLLETERAALPTPYGSWDPGMVRVDGDWLVTFVESPSQDPFDFHPALARTRAERWHEDLSPVAAAGGLHQCEGPLVVEVGGRHWFLASDGDARLYPVMDLEGRRVGRLDAPYPTNIPHPQLVPDPAGGWWMITFNGSQFHRKVMGYGGHGDVVLMHST